MANYGTTTVHRATASPPAAVAATAASTPTDYAKHSTRRNLSNFKFTIPFDIPSSPEAAAVRIIGNLTYFRPYYLIFVWSVLVITLLPAREDSLKILMAITVVACLFLLLLRSQPLVIEKLLVLALFAVVTVVAMILTDATIHFFATLAGSMPVILVHAVLRIRDDRFSDHEVSAAGDLAPLVNKTAGDTEPEALV